MAFLYCPCTVSTVPCNPVAVVLNYRGDHCFLLAVAQARRPQLHFCDFFFQVASLNLVLSQILPHVSKKFVDDFDTRDQFGHKSVVLSQISISLLLKSCFLRSVDNYSTGISKPRTSASLFDIIAWHRTVYPKQSSELATSGYNTYELLHTER